MLQAVYTSQQRDYNCGSFPDAEVAMTFARITVNPAVMAGKPCIRGLRVTVSTILGLLATGESRERILEAYPYLEPADLDECLSYAAWRLGEREEDLVGT